MLAHMNLYCAGKTAACGGILDPWVLLDTADRSGQIGVEQVSPGTHIGEVSQLDWLGAVVTHKDDVAHLKGLAMRDGIAQAPDAECYTASGQGPDQDGAHAVHHGWVLWGERRHGVGSGGERGNLGGLCGRKPWRWRAAGGEVKPRSNKGLERIYCRGLLLTRQVFEFPDFRRATSVSIGCFLGWTRWRWAGFRRLVVVALSG